MFKSNRFVENVKNSWRSWKIDIDGISYKTIYQSLMQIREFVVYLHESINDRIINV